MQDWNIFSFTRRDVISAYYIALVVHGYGATEYQIYLATVPTTRMVDVAEL